jgi:penicillin V acylase-like amidase (Ntn superfamily)
VARFSKFMAAVLASGMAGTPQAKACSRVTYLGPEHMVVTGRSMDWVVPVETNLWAFPAGIERNGAVDDNALAWKSRYGSVIAAAYDAATADGINEKGLVANLLYLSVADYGVRDKSRPGLSVAGWTQYVLDNFATVAEAVDALRAEPFQLVGVYLPGGYEPSLHLAISDATGDSAVFEYLGGKLVIHHGRQYTVMTNEPPYDQQLALNAYWQEIGGTAMLPGTERPADRFVRASYYLRQVPQTADPVLSVANMFSIMRNVSVPFGAATPGAPNVAPTLWRTTADQKDRVYYFESTVLPNVFWVTLDKLNLKPRAPTLKLPVEDGPVRAGDVAESFAPDKPFQFMPGAH